MSVTCEHLEQVVLPKGHPPRVCAECVALGDGWVHLRQCMSCGQVGCCDSSKNRHATKHFEASGHPVARSLEEGWLWCYVDEVVSDL